LGITRGKVRDRIASFSIHVRGFRRLFDAAHDGILIQDASTQKITHVNPFLTKLLDYKAEHFLGKELWEIGFLQDKQASVLAMQQLDDTGSIQYDGLPLEDKHGQKHPADVGSQ
jgi:PAS domain S-box-containing protein